jgi:hypothetical protein
MVDGAEREAGVFLKALDQRVEERLAHLESVMTGTTRTEPEDPWNICSRGNKCSTQMVHTDAERSATNVSQWQVLALRG